MLWAEGCRVSDQETFTGAKDPNDVSLLNTFINKDWEMDWTCNRGQKGPWKESSGKKLGMQQTTSVKPWLMNILYLD